MKKWKHTLLISTLVLGAMPYSAINPSIQANAVEVETQEVPSIQAEETTESKAEVAPVVPTEIENGQSLENAELEPVKETDVFLDENANQTQTTDLQQSDLVNQDEHKMNITPRKTLDFTLIVDGVLVGEKDSHYHTNVSNLSFTRSDEYNVSYEFAISYGNTQLLNMPNNNIVDLTPYKDEGIYIVDLTGFNERGRVDTGEFYNNVQRTASSVDIDGVINTPGTIVENPSSITVGKDANDQYGTPHYTWEIKDAAGNVIMSGTDVQPNQAEIDNLPAGEYTISNTVTEELPKGYVSNDPITDTTSGKFKITAGNVIVEHILVDSKGNPLPTPPHTTTNQSGKIGSGYETTPIEIPGYELVVEKTPENQNGSYTKEDQVVKYYYKKIKTNINVEYVDEQGNPISTGDKISGEFGDDYNSKPKEIPGYDLVAVPDNAGGKHTDKDQTVKYVYKKKKTEVNVHFVDEKGNPLAESDLINGVFDDPYDTAPKLIPGYIVTVVPNNANGKHSVDPTDVTYVYKKIEAPVVNDSIEGAKEVTGTGMPNTQVIVTFPNGATARVDVDKDGKWTAPVPEGVELKKGDKVTAVTVDPLTGATSDSGVGKVTPLSNKDPETGAKTPTNNLKPNNSGIVPTEETNRSNQVNETKQAKPNKNKLPNTGETNNASVISIGFLSLILVFFSKLLQNRKAD